MILLTYLLTYYFFEGQCTCTSQTMHVDGVLFKEMAGNVQSLNELYVTRGPMPLMRWLDAAAAANWRQNLHVGRNSDVRGMHATLGRWQRSRRSVVVSEYRFDLIELVVNASVYRYTTATTCTGRRGWIGVIS